jgi:hypothetical protein
MSVLDLAFPAMGGRARLILADRAPGHRPSPRLRHAAAGARALLAELERRWTRFAPDSDLSLLTADPRREIPAHPHVLALVRAGAWAGRISGGLVDMTLGDELARAGYGGHWAGETAPLSRALAAAPARAAAAPHPAGRWQALGADRRAGTVRRPAGVTLDSGGLGRAWPPTSSPSGWSACATSSTSGATSRWATAEAARTRSRSRTRGPAASPTGCASAAAGSRRRGSTGACGSTPPAARPTTCSTRRPAGRPGRGCWRSPRSGGRRWRPR